MARRTNREMEEMRNFVTLDLLANANDPHKAWDACVKTHIELGKPVPTYVKGLEDYVKVSKELEEEHRKKRKGVDQEELRDYIRNRIQEMDLVEMKEIYRSYKGNLTKYHKLNLMDVYVMVYHQDFKGLNDALVDTFIYNEIPVDMVLVK